MKNKVVLLGAPGVGKTSFFLCVTRQFQAFEGKRALAYQPTIGATYAQLQTYVDEAGTVTHVTTDPRYCGIKGETIDLWDTAGQERYNSLLPMYIRQARVVIVMHEDSMDSLRRAANEIINARAAAPNAKIFVVQTKSDMGHDFNYKFVQENKADGWAYVCTIGDDFNAVDNAILAIAKLTASFPPEEEEPLKMMEAKNQSFHQCCA